MSSKIVLRGDMMDELITKDEVCSWLKISRATIDRWRSQGMPCIKVGRKVRFEENKVKEWISNNFEQQYGGWRDDVK